jgi:hypothetical protein
LFRKDRTPYDPYEIEVFKQAIARSKEGTCKLHVPEDVDRGMMIDAMHKMQLPNGASREP